VHEDISEKGKRQKAKVRVKPFSIKVVSAELSSFTFHLIKGEKE
jgi:hypothetical protein